MKKKSTVGDFTAGTQILVQAADGREVRLIVSWKNNDGSVYAREWMRIKDFLGGDHGRWIGPFQVDATMSAQEVGYDES